VAHSLLHLVRLDAVGCFPVQSPDMSLHLHQPTNQIDDHRSEGHDRKCQYPGCLASTVHLFFLVLSADQEKLAPGLNPTKKKKKKKMLPSLFFLSYVFFFLAIVVLVV
jgi:hypothetical protein